MSFKPGLSSKQRLSIQQQTTFYTQKFGDNFEPVDDSDQTKSSASLMNNINLGERIKPQTA
jgi:hypothetical protein